MELALIVQRVHPLLFEVHAHPLRQALQLPDVGQAVKHVPRKAADRLGDDVVDLPRLAVPDHLLEALALFRTGATDTLVRKNVNQCPNPDAS